MQDQCISDGEISLREQEREGWQKWRKLRLTIKLKTFAKLFLFLKEEESIVEEEEFTYEDDFDLDLESRRGTMIEGFIIEDQ